MKKLFVFLLLMVANCGFYAHAESPYEWASALILESVTNLEGGVREGSSGLANFDLTLVTNTEAAGWWSGGEWFAYVLGNSGDNPSEDVGDVQGISNIATDEALMKGSEINTYCKRDN